MGILADIQTLEPGARVELFELDATSILGDHLFFHGYPQASPIFWQGNAYMPWAIEAQAFARDGSGQQPSPTLTVGNIGVDINGNPLAGVISSMCMLLDDMVGAKIIRHVTLAQYLDAANFPEGNPSADPTQELPQEIWYIEQKTSETSASVEFMLSNALDFNGVQLPQRQILAGVCSWIRIGGYRGKYCGYTGTNMFDEFNNPVTDPTKDVCAGTLTACKLRFGEFEQVNFGGFPAASLT